MWDQTSKQQATPRWKNTSKALGIPQSRLPFELGVSVTQEGMSQTLWQKQQKGRYSRNFGPSSERGQKSNKSPRATIPNSTHSTPPGGTSQEGTYTTATNRLN